MYKMHKKAGMVEITFSGSIDKEEMAKWVTESVVLVRRITPGFGVFVDMRTLSPLNHEAQIQMQIGQKIFFNAGMKKSVVIVNSPVIAMQFKRTAKETGIYQFERYIDASKDANWREHGEAWLLKNIDPDK